MLKLPNKIKMIRNTIEQSTKRNNDFILTIVQLKFKFIAIGNFMIEKETGAEMRPEMVSGIVTGYAARQSASSKL